MRLLAVCLCFLPVGVAADSDASAFLAKARSAFIENRAHERHWTWTTTTTRSIIDKHDNVLEQIPSVTVESPIRSDGKRCNAVLAWGDGREPYLANADADARCTVEQEAQDSFRLDALLRSAHVKIRSRSPQAITLAIDADKGTKDSTDPVQRCTGSAQAIVQIDPATFYPKHIEVTFVESGCEQQVTVVNHYDDRPISKALSAFRKGSVLQLDYALQRAKAGNAENDFWICEHRHAVNQLRGNSRGLILWGRQFELTSSGGDRRVVVDGTTVANELATESTLKFETETKKDK
ncbi:MAG TPA: hypothetical protein VNX18_19140 [Bryobacteraceae bacterium]|nr:hypothetical protein [Bryobacteraceae bacterium]